MLTRLLLIANVAIYLWTWSRGETRTDAGLVAAGAFYGPYVAQGQWWRVFSTAFLHVNLLHIGTNMFALWQVGSIVEALAGRVRFALIYLIAILGAGYAIYTFNFDTVTVGASGAIFGLFGALLAFGLRMGAQGRMLVQQMLGVVILNVVIGFLVPNISMAGHIGGLLAGIVAGFLLHRQPRRPATVEVAVAGEPGTVVHAELHPPEPR